MLHIGFVRQKAGGRRQEAGGRRNYWLYVLYLSVANIQVFHIN
jgi:hypothetical protein